MQFVCKNYLTFLKILLTFTGTYSITDNDHLVEVSFGEEGRVLEANTERITSYASTQLWRLVDIGNNQVRLKKILDVPIFMNPRIPFLSLFCHDRENVFNKLTFFETFVNWNCLDYMRENLFIFTSIPPIQKSDSYQISTTMMYSMRPKIFSGFEYGLVIFNCNCNGNYQTFIPSRYLTWVLDIIVHTDNAL